MALTGGKDVCGASDGVPEFVDGASGFTFEVGLELGKGHLDRIKVGAIGWQEAQLGAGLVDGEADAGGAMGGQIVHHHDIAGLERGNQDLFDIGEEGGAVHGAIEDHGGAHAGKSQGTDEGCGLPVPVRHRRPAALATARSPAASGHLG